MNSTVGVDEVGRGCWAGPLVAGAVVLGQPIAGLKDSKKLSHKQRARLAASIEVEALALGLGWVSPAEIDKWGLTVSVRTAMQRALNKIQVTYNRIIIDGGFNFFPENFMVEAVVRADDSVPAVSAASIIAKVARDKYMAQASDIFPDYAFAKHVGYGTKLHAEMLKLHGPCELHRKSYKPVKAHIK